MNSISDMSIQLCVQTSNCLDEVYTNRIYISLSTFQIIFPNVQQQQITNTNYVKIKIGDLEYILSCLSNKTMKSDCIALSKSMRDWMNVNIKDDIYIEKYEPFNNDQCNEITLTIDYLNKVKKEGTSNNKMVNGQEIIKIVLNCFENQYFNVGQSFFIRNNTNTQFELKVHQLSLTATSDTATSDTATTTTTTTTNIGKISLSTKINLIKSDNSSIIGIDMDSSPIIQKNQIFTKDWNFENMGIGGLDAEFRDIFRRAFSSRIFPPSIVKKLGVNHVKGMLLYGPPGTGKTLIARQIGKMLNGREPKLVSGPSILNRFVGQSEENIRNLFKDAEIEQKEKGDESGLHVIIFDELDSICKSRGKKSSSGSSGVGDSVVNQLLAMIDGVESLNNILVIGMTNRKDMIDEALLRPGRLEVHIEISLPNEHGREQIFKIHTTKMKQQNVLENDVDLSSYASYTRNYSGAEIEGVVKSAASYAFSRQLNYHDNFEEIKICDQDFKKAINEITPSFGSTNKQFENYAENGICNYGIVFDKLLKNGNIFIQQVLKSKRTSMLSILLTGKPGCGKSSFASILAKESKFPFIRIISSNDLIGLNEKMKSDKITKIFEDSYKSPLSCIVVDEIERIIEYVSIGPCFSNKILQTLSVLFKKLPPKGNKLLIISTTSNPQILKQMDLIDSFSAILNIPSITSNNEFKEVLSYLDFTINQIDQLLSHFNHPITIKQLIMIAEMSKQEQGNLIDNFKNYLNHYYNQQTNLFK